MQGTLTSFLLYFRAQILTMFFAGVTFLSTYKTPPRTHKVCILSKGGNVRFQACVPEPYVYFEAGIYAHFLFQNDSHACQEKCVGLLSPQTQGQM